MNIGMEFKEYLEKNSWILNSHSDTKVITIETLGKWAVNSIKTNKQIKEKLIQENDLRKSQSYLMAFGKEEFAREIAVACLGEVEIQKRLEGKRNE